MAELSISFPSPHPQWRPILHDVKPRLTCAAKRILAQEGYDRRPVEIAIMLIDDEASRKLNHRFRDRDAPTDVLAFPAVAPFPPTEGECPLPLGDIALARQTIAAEAESRQRPPLDHIAHLTVHAILHLIGHTHDVESRRLEMERREIACLKTMGIDNPYLPSE